MQGSTQKQCWQSQREEVKYLHHNLGLLIILQFR